MPELLSQCRDCSRLVAHRETIAARFPEYHCLPVAASGSRTAPILLAGLAPGLHGANRTGVPFTGDASGDFLFDHLVRRGWARAMGNGHELIGVRITNVVKCLPPGNKPVAAEVNACRRHLIKELETLPEPAVVVTLGRIAHDAVARALAMTVSRVPFGHGAVFPLKHKRWMVASYHPSRYNTNTGRMNDAMFSSVLDSVEELLS
jgi:uracil-DNA glycosylase family 4